MKDPEISPQLDRQCAAYAHRMHEESGRGFIFVNEGEIYDIRQELTEKHLEGYLKDLIETMIKVYKVESEYVLVVYKNTSLYYIGTRSL
jgi:hypothetical protein